MEIEKRISELRQIEMQLNQQVVLAERNLQGLREQLASVKGGIIELQLLEQQKEKKKKYLK
jgi:hypothetical protein